MYPRKGLFEGEEYCNGEVAGGSKKVRRPFKKPIDGDVINELSHKNFAPQSQKKI